MRTALVKRQKVYDDFVVPVMSTVMDILWILDVTCEPITVVERSNRRYRGVTDDDAGQRADVQDDVVDDLDDMFVQGALWKGEDGSFFTAENRSVRDTAFKRLSKTASALGPELADIVNGFGDEVEASQEATAEDEKVTERQKWLFSVEEKTKEYAMSNVASWRG